MIKMEIDTKVILSQLENIKERINHLKREFRKLTEWANELEIEYKKTGKKIEELKQRLAELEGDRSEI